VFAGNPVYHIHSIILISIRLSSEKVASSKCRLSREKPAFWMHVSNACICCIKACISQSWISFHCYLHVLWYLIFPVETPNNREFYAVLSAELSTWKLEATSGSLCLTNLSCIVLNGMTNGSQFFDCMRMACFFGVDHRFRISKRSHFVNVMLSDGIDFHHRQISVKLPYKAIVGIIYC
jgi:hypothetical protein